MNNELALQNQNYIELNEKEELAVNGGIGVLGAVALGTASYFAYEFANEGVKRSTGKSISENITYYSGKALNGIGEGLTKVGDFLTQ